MEEIKKRKKHPDLFDKWEESGELPAKLEQLTKWKRALVTQGEMAKALGITEEYFTKLKKKHPQIQEAFDKALVMLKHNLVGAMYKKALGYDVEETDMIVDDNGKTTPKKKVHTSTRHIPGDYNTQVYLLNKFFGETFNANYDMLKLQREKNESKENEEVSETQTILVDDVV